MWSNVLEHYGPAAEQKCEYSDDYNTIYKQAQQWPDWKKQAYNNSNNSPLVIKIKTDDEKQKEQDKLKELVTYYVLMRLI